MSIPLPKQCNKPILELLQSRNTSVSLEEIREHLRTTYNVSKKEEQTIVNGRKAFNQNLQSSLQILRRQGKVKNTSIGYWAFDSTTGDSSKNDDPDWTFESASELDARKKINAAITQRRGGTKFRNSLLEAYGNRCTVTGSTVIDVLEGAHIVPYRGDHTNHVRNGLLLRADIHTLFDKYMLAIDPDSLRVILAANLRNSEYEQLHNQKVRKPKSKASYPNKDALKFRLNKFKEQNR